MSKFRSKVFTFYIDIENTTANANSRAAAWRHRKYLRKAQTHTGSMRANGENRIPAGDTRILPGKRDNVSFGSVGNIRSGASTNFRRLSVTGGEETASELQPLGAGKRSNYRLHHTQS